MATHEGRGRAPYPGANDRLCHRFTAVLWQFRPTPSDVVPRGTRGGASCHPDPRAGQVLAMAGMLYKLR